MLLSICQQIWKTLQRPQDSKSFHPSLKEWQCQRRFKVLVGQSCPTLCNPMDSSIVSQELLCPWNSVGKNMEVVAISFSNAWTWKVKVKSLSRVQLLATPWTAAYQAPPSMGFSRQEYQSGVPLPSLEGERGEWKSWLKTQHLKKWRSWHLVPSLHGK